MIKKIIVMLLVVSMMVGFGACSSEEPAGKVVEEGNTPATGEPTAVSGKVDKIKEEGKIVLGTAAGYPPFEFHKIIDGKDQIIGVDLEIAQRIADELGVELEIVDMKFEGVIPALVTDDIDMIIAGMVATEERSKAVDFSVPYYQANHKIVIRLEDKDKFIEFADLDVEGAKIGVQKATTQDTLANEICKNAEVIGVSLLPDVVMEVKGGKIDAAIIAEPVAMAYVSQNEDLYMPDITLGQEPGINIAVNKGNQDLLDAINPVVEEMIANDEIIGLVEKYNALAQE